MFASVGISSGSKRCFAFLIGGAIIFTKNGVTSEFLLNLLFYIIITPVITLTLTKIMYMSENGCALSGGERQRISIARAFLKNAPIILLDEAIASLDAENETAIQTALSKLIQNKTVLVIAHRM